VEPETHYLRTEASELRRYVANALVAIGIGAVDADIVSDVFVRASEKQVGHHDIYDFPGRLKVLRRGRINSSPDIRAVASKGAVESLDGDNGLGELGASFAMDHALDLASEFGIGFSTISNTNHFLAGSPYVERANERGYFGLILSRTIPSMGVPGGRAQAIGNNPIGFGIPVAGDHNVVADFSMSYASWGKLREFGMKSVTLPDYWANGPDGLPTSDPQQALLGAPLPIGGYKGFALALLVESMTSLLGGGLESNEVSIKNSGVASHAHTAIAIDIGALTSLDLYERRAALMLDHIRELDSSVPLTVPGDGSHRNRSEAHAKGIKISIELASELDEWSDDLGIERLRLTSE
jgi:LDH2 family malate/lactate/ureidoglycolate dehydrogenase